eukprot:6440620-Amphidinium_carterae.1
MSQAEQTLKRLGYEYREGCLKQFYSQVGSDEGFKFTNQRDYDDLAEAVLDYVGARRTCTSVKSQHIDAREGLAYVYGNGIADIGKHQHQHTPTLLR